MPQDIINAFALGTLNGIVSSIVIYYAIVTIKKYVWL